MKTIPAEMTVRIAMTPEVRALVDETVRLHAEIAGCLETIAREMNEQIHDNTYDWPDRLRELAAKLKPAEEREPR